MAAQPERSRRDPLGHAGESGPVEQLPDCRAFRDPVLLPVESRAFLQHRLHPDHGSEESASARLTNASTIVCAIWSNTGPSSRAISPLRIS